MKISALLTSAGINIGLCALFLTLYSLLRKQPKNVGVYFGRKLSEARRRHDDLSFSLDRLVPSAGWIVKAWGSTEDDILRIAGLDAVVFLRILVFSIRIFSIAAVVCLFGVLPLNYFGRDIVHKEIPSETLDVFTIGNVQEGSRWLWEYKNISSMWLDHFAASPPNPRHFSVLVRSIPRNQNEPFDVTIVNFFTKYHGSSYLSHQMIYQTGTVQKIVSNAKKAYKKIVRLKDTSFNDKHRASKYRCGLCGGKSHSFALYHNEFELDARRVEFENSVTSKKKKESSAAFVFFKTRYAALVASQVPQSSDPMLWAIDMAPEPHDVYWSNLWVPYRVVWFRRITGLIATLSFMVVFLIPVTFVQGLSQLEKLHRQFPFLKGALEKPLVIQLVTGYFPSAILTLALYIVPPMMMLFSGLEGPISQSGRRRSACLKVLFFTIWNIFFVNVFSGSVIGNIISSPKDIPLLLAKAIPQQATFFITYVLTSGWTSLSAELLQIFPLVSNFLTKILCKRVDDPNSVPSFPYYTEVPRVLLFGLIGFTCSILAPLILPFLLVYFSLGYLVYRNQVLNVYRIKYDYGGKFWPLAHNTTIFSLVLTQIIALGVFGLKKSQVALGFTIPLVTVTLLFNEYCRHRFGPIFSNLSAQDLIEMDQYDEERGRMDEIHRQLLTLYRQYPKESDDHKELDGDRERGGVGSCSTNSLQELISAMPSSS